MGVIGNKTKIMNWEQKKEMCNHLNKEEYSQALDLVISNIETMDDQAWDMFYNGIGLVEEQIKKYIEKHKVIRERNKSMTFDSYRTAARASVYDTLVHTMLTNNFELKIDDGICKGFKNGYGVDFFINKAYDDDTKTHALLIYVPKIPEFNILAVQQPLFYESEAERDRVYSENLNDEFVNDFWKNLISTIKEQKKNQENNKTND